MEKEKEIIDLVIARLQTLPENKSISIGGSAELTKDQLIKHVENNDSIGRKIIEIEMSFLRALKDGAFYTEEYVLGNAS